MSLDDRTKQLILASYQEDLGQKGDITTNSLIFEDLCVSAQIFSKETAVISGQDVAQYLVQRVDPTLKYTILKDSGTVVKKGSAIARLEGSGRSILQLERTLLNFLQHLSGVATQTRQFVKEMNNSTVALLDTRKTIPSLRSLQKQAVLHGGGQNHRMGLYDHILIKENHLSILASILKCSVKEAIMHALKKVTDRCKTFIEIEVQSEEQALIACECGADAILLDNMTVNEIEHISSKIKAFKKRPLLEASGNVSLKKIALIARTGVDRISVGMLTTSLRAIDLSLLIDLPAPNR